MTADSETRLSVKPKVQVIQSFDWDYSNWTEIVSARNVVCSISLGSSISEARFETSRGEMWMKGDGLAGFTDQGEDLTSYLGYWVRISADLDFDGDDDYEWFGVITDVNSDYLGASGPSAVDNQVVCLGPEYLLTKVQIASSRIQRGLGFITIDRPVSFNSWVSEIKGRSILAGNFNSGLIPADYAFEANPDPTTSVPWTAQEIVEYLMINHAPTTTPAWGVDSSEADMYSSLDFAQQAIETEGATVYDILNAVLTRRRGLTWSLRIQKLSDTSGNFLIRPRTVTPVDVSLITGKTLKANVSKHSISYQTDQNVLGFQVLNSIKRSAQRVRVRGSRAGVIGTFRVNTDLVAVWNPAEETAYENGASASAGYGALTVGEKAIRNDTERTTEEKEIVYTTYEIDSSWSGLLDGETAIDTSVNWFEQMRFENYLPLLRGLDYTVPTTPIGVAENEFIRPIVVIDDNTGGGTFLYVDRLSSHAYNEDFGDGLNFSCSVNILNDRMGLKVMPTTVPHSIGAGDYAATEPSEYTSRLDWRTIQATLYFLTDEYCEGFAPIGPVVPVHDQVSELVIDIGDRARYDVVLNKTVIGIEYGSLLKTTAGGAINDDRNFCQSLAEAAYVLYGNDYNALRYTVGEFDTTIEVGDMIESYIDRLSTIDVNTVVSLVEIDFERHTTSVITEQFEIDVTLL